MSLYRRLQEVQRDPDGAVPAARPGPRRAPPEGPPPPHRRGRPAALRPPGQRGRAAAPASRSSSRPSSAGRRCRSRPWTGPAPPGRPRRRPRLRARSTGCWTTPTSPRSWSTGPSGSTSSATGKIELSGASFLDETHLRRIIEKIVAQVGRRVDEATPMVDARLPDGSRVNAIISPAGHRRPLPHHPEVLQGPLHGRGPDPVRDVLPAGGATSSTPA